MQSSEIDLSQTELQPLPPEEWPRVDHLVTDDGAPVDNIFSEKQMRLLTEPLHSSWKTSKSFVAFANVGIFYAVDTPPVVPDVFLSINVRLPEDLFPKINQSYFVWKYGKPPEVVIEIVSNKKGGELDRKLKIYGDMHVTNYVIFDSDLLLSQKPLRLFRLQTSEMVEDESDSCRFPDLGLGLTIWKGRYEEADSHWLRWTDVANELIPTGAERAQALDKQKSIIEQEKSIIEQEKSIIEQEKALAEQEMDRLRRLLLKHGIDPSQK